MENDRLSALLAKKMAGEATPEEQRELHDYLQSHAGDEYFAEMLHMFWAAGAEYKAPYNPGSEAHFQYILQKAAEPETTETAPAVGYRRRIFRISLAAAAMLMLTLLAWQFISGFSEHTNIANASNEVVIQHGAKSKVLLPDGTQVWLNSGSKLIYPGVFNDTLREVTLEGEGYFMVTKNPAQPFVVHTSEIDIHVIGTVFNVKSYAEDEVVETTLLQGSIAVEKRNTDDAARIMLRPHEKLVIRKKDTSLPDPAAKTGTDKNSKIENSQTSAPLLSVMQLPQHVPDSTRTETSWVYGRLVFEGDHFYELALKMERWYNKKIKIRDGRVSQYRFTGMFENETLEEALRALQLTASFRFRIDGNDVIIEKP
ncbi:MAG TPA: DUF4974 domain-containing protein [Saprospiraceae bacterium]|nr:DUF4974 domain-containing protein [Saprospiraceae bacterium]HPI04960.1 DUF4974 domain-containing protein [Saprospiraceae bacterium]